MSWMRTGIFISLTLVATTLPASARPAALPPSNPAEASGQPACPPESGSAGEETKNPAPSEDERSRQGSELLLQAACQLDVWKSAPTRPMGNSGPQVLAGIMQGLPVLCRPSLAAGQDLQSCAGRVHEHARDWLTCRYPNAPPVVT